MSMTTWLLLVVYSAVWPVASAAVARWLARDARQDVTPDMAAMGAIVGLSWPLALPVAFVYWLARRESPAERRDRLAVERDEKVREQAHRIALLEREAGIR